MVFVQNVPQEKNVQPSLHLAHPVLLGHTVQVDGKLANPALRDICVLILLSSQKSVQKVLILTRKSVFYV